MLDPATVPLGMRADEVALVVGRGAVGLRWPDRRAAEISTFRRLREWCARETGRDAGA